MKTQIIGIIVGILLIITSTPLASTLSYTEGASTTILNRLSKIDDPLDGGWIEERDGVIILHVSGTYYEMGYQQGYLLKNIIEQNYRLLLDSGDPEIYNLFLEIWNGILSYTTPEIYKEEMQGLADGSGRSFEDVVVFSIGFLAYIFSHGCGEMVAWGPATSDGELYHYYSADIHEMVKDPKTGTYVHDNQILIVRNPDDGYASLGVLLPGGVGSWGGINENAISIAGENSPSFDETYYCIHPMIKFRMILDSASSAVDAIDILLEKPKGGGNHHVGDGKVPVGYVHESTANYFYIGAWDDPTENIHPFWQIDYVLRRKNMFIHPLTASTQRNFYNPKIYLILGMRKSVTNWFNPWRYYKTMSKETEKIWGDINCNTTMDMVRSIYRGETDLYLRFLHRLGVEKFGSYHQWVCCPKTGDMTISFARGENYAQHADVHYFNLFELLDSEPSP